MQNIISDIRLDGSGVDVAVAALPPGVAPLRVSAYRQTSVARDLWTTVPVNVTVRPDGLVTVRGEPGSARVFVSAPS